MQGPELEEAQDDSEFAIGWSVKCVKDALASHNVAQAVAEALTGELKGSAGERALRSSELVTLAEKLLAASKRPQDEEAAS
jgi:hypothetical protein